ncbi:MAG: hypothetical protein ABL308_02110 [Oceanicaulis sp.]
MRTLILLAAVTAIAGCANAPSLPGAPPAASQPEAPVRTDSLPPQRLAPGQCGVFLFELREPNAFVFFEDETARRVKIVHDGRIIETGVTPQSGAFVPGDQIRRVYLAQADNLTFTLTGRVGEETGSGLRVEDALLKTRFLDGSEIVRPLGGVRRCEDGR